MANGQTYDLIFRDAVAAIDAGDVEKLQDILISNPGLVGQRLESAGDWLRDKIGNALDGYFKQPYLLWFVADNPIRIDKLPSNIVAIANVIIQAIRRAGCDSFQYQLDYTLGLVVTGRIPHECGVQIGLMDLLIDAGAKPGSGIGAIAHGNLSAAEHLVARGGDLTLPVAVCLQRMDDVMRLAKNAGAADLQLALAAAAFYGMPAMITLLIGMGADMNAYPDGNTGFHSHATPLHQAVFSGSLDAVKVLIEAGAKTDLKDRLYDGTPLEWAEYMSREENDDLRKKKFAAIAAYLKGQP